jgi:hypothetical protein
MTFRPMPATARLLALTAVLLMVVASGPARAQITEQALLDSLQRTAFQFFWDEANPANGLIRDRNQPWSPASIASTGFGLSAITVGVDHGWVTRTDAANRVLTTLTTFWNGPQGTGSIGYMGYKGWFYHFLDMNTGTRAWTSELSSIDTALLLAGILHCRQYFTGGDAAETEIRALADSIYRRVDFKWMQNLGTGIRMGWFPESGFIGAQWTGYNEAMILYILAIGSPVPTKATPASAWNTWTYYYNWNTEYGYTYIIFPPLFGHQYSHCWVDFRAIQDQFCRNRGITYFENSRRATYAQRAYSIANPFNWVGYGDSLWGITASDVQGGYAARGAPPAQNDDGTIAPTAPGGSIPFAPEICIPTLRNMYNDVRALHPQIWGKYGFKDAFNLTNGWFGTDYIGIDQGPFVLMIENHLHNRVWQWFMSNPDVQNGLTRIGFTPVLDAGDPAAGGDFQLYPGEPNPFARRTTIRYRLGRSGPVRLTIFDVQGRVVARPVDGVQAAGAHTATFDAGALASGVYHVRLEHDGAVRTRSVVRMR